MLNRKPYSSLGKHVICCGFEGKNACTAILEILIKFHNLLNLAFSGTATIYLIKKPYSKKSGTSGKLTGDFSFQIVNSNNFH
ncbi:MAG: hypothetical protein A2161_02530 [Candidatus Schekmanbacteria bacterium RBG_13_48_7]|uniref:Uncharacterized protein n=1 Tax=Candidatus Schekmanbacteria bacterium RBG_13_48_7 TaxID=1817878 RepID=A0A1F7RK74_9BACT|nr:MAG: hypothetical protein A2161_02530 [Candidatus Schekmanbacteria bacterium RBG_13_48_7]